MRQMHLKRKYEQLRRPEQSFREFVVQEIELCHDQLIDAMVSASKDSNGRPVIYILQRHVSRSGMSRTFSLHYFDLQTGELMQLNYVSAVLLGLSMDLQRNGIKIKASDMDVGSVIVNNLASIVYGGGNKVSHKWV